MAETKIKSAASKSTVTAKKAPIAAKKPAVKSAKSTASKPGPKEHYSMVQVAAYYIAERNNFIGNPLEFWTAAEAQIKNMLAKR